MSGQMSPPHDQRCELFVEDVLGRRRLLFAAPLDATRCFSGETYPLHFDAVTKHHRSYAELHRLLSRSHPRTW